MRTVPEPEALREALTKTWAAQGIDVAALSAEGHDTRATLRRDPVGRSSAGLPLPALLAPLEDGVPQIELGATLGEGGMGVVYAARQTSLDREVAVKVVRGEEDADRRGAQLLREARVTGALEHPNVVPIYTLGRDDAGRPLIVMKRIEGRPWSERLRDVPLAERRAEGFLRQHLGVLGQVARALHFAHARRLLHRDVKPDNVMIGAFGEVYLVDWGIAVALDPAPRGVPRARDVARIEGTPVYLAPEMAGGDGPSIDERSDVYLLGATLHEILTGEPPHAGTELRAVLFKAYVSDPPEYPEWVWPELAAIARRALARQRDDRYASAADFAHALDDLLTHRSSMQLSHEAARRAEELETRASEPLGPSTYALFHEARFAFDQALLAWPENEHARAGRRAVLASMIQLELAHGTASAALALLHTLEDPPAELDAEVRRAVEAERAHLAHLSALARDADLAVGAKTRRGLTYVAGLGWAATCIACGALTRTGVLAVEHTEFALVQAGCFATTVVALLLTRDQTMANTANRRISYMTMLVFFAGTFFWPLLGALEVAMPDATVLGAFVATVVWASVALTIGREWAPFSAGSLIVVIGAWRWPAWHFEIYGLMGIAQAGLAGRLMLREDERRARDTARGPSRATDPRA